MEALKSVLNKIQQLNMMKILSAINSSAYLIQAIPLTINGSAYLIQTISLAKITAQPI